MKGQFFIVAAIIMVIGIVSVVNTLSIPKEVKEVEKSEVGYFLKSIKNTVLDLYASWPYPREHRRTIKLTSYGCDPYVVSVKTLVDFPNDVDSGSVIVTRGYEVLSDQVLWENLEEKIGYVVFPSYLGCESQELQLYYNLLGESWEEMEPGPLIYYTNTSQQIEVRGIGYKVVIDKTQGGAITLIQMLGEQDMITKVESLYRCNGTSYEQYNSNPLIDILYSGPVLLVVRIRGNHGISTRESFTQYVYFYPERVEIREVGSVAETIYCDPSQEHTYGHLVQLSGSPIYTENGWIEYNYGEYGLAILKNDSYFESFDLSTTYAYLNAWDSTTMAGSKEYWLTLYPHPGGSEKVMDYDSKLRNLAVEVGGEESKDSLMSLYKNTLSDFMGGFGYLVSISREKGEIYENYSGQPSWLHLVSEYPNEEPGKDNILTLHFEEGTGNKTYDSSDEGNNGVFYGEILNDGELRNDIFDEFEDGNYDGWTLDCGGEPVGEMVSGYKSDYAFKINSTGGDGLACAYKSYDAVDGETIFYACKGYGCRLCVWNGSQYISDCVSHPFSSDWKIYSIKVKKTQSNVRIYLYNDGITGHWAAYDFITEGPIWVKGKSGNALRFDGVENRIAVPSTEDLKYRGENKTILFWINVDPKETTGGKIISKAWNGNGKYNYWVAWTGTDKITVRLTGGNGTVDYIYELTTSDSFPKGVWLFLAVTFSSDRKVKIYVNGTIKAQGTHSIDEWNPRYGDTNVSLCIGSLYPYGGTWAGNEAFSINGTLDEVRIYNRSLSEDEIQEIYKNNTFIRDGLIAYWRFEEGKGDEASDSHIWDYDGKFGKAMSFDGKDDYVKLSDSGMEWDFKTFSAEFWIKTTDATSVLGEGAKWRPLILSNGKVRFWIRGLSNGVDSADYLDGNKVVGDGNFHQVVVTYDIATKKMQIYVDGELDAEKTTTVEIYEDGHDNQAIGCGYVGSPGCIEAVIDEVRVYNRVLGAEEVKEHYERKITPRWRKTIYLMQDRESWPVSFNLHLPEAEGIVIADEYGNVMPSQLHAEAEYPYETPDEYNILTYHFDEGSGSTAHDSSGNGNDGTLYYYQVSSTADVADTNSTQCVDDDSLSTSDDFYNGWTFKATSGAAAGQTTTIADYDYVSTSYRVLYFSTELTGFSQGDNYELYLDQEGPDWVTGKFNGALEFDGQNDYVQRGGVFDPSSASFTLEAWFLSYSPPSEPSRFVLAKTSSMGTIYIRQYYGKVYGAIVGNYSNPDSQSTIQGGSIEPGRWYHVVMTYDKQTGEHKLYLNGKLIGTNVKNITDWSNLPGSSFYVGAYWSGASPSSFWNGLIDEVRVYTRVLSGEEIKEHYESRSLLSILGSGKYYVYYDNKSIIHAEGSDLSFNKSDLEVSNSFIEWDFDDYYFSYEGSPNWFASANKWYTFNGTHEAFSLSDFTVLESGPAAIKIGAQALNVFYNFTIFAFNPFILVEVSGPERVRFGPFWSVNGDDDYYMYFQGEESTFKNISYKGVNQEKYVWLGKRDDKGALIAFVPYSKLYPGNLSAGTNFMWVEVQGDKDPKVYLLPDEFSSWEYDYWKESFEGEYVFLDELEKMKVNLASSKVRVSAEVS